MRKKIISFFLTLVLCFGLTLNITALEYNAQESSADENCQINSAEYLGMTDIPPKSEKILEKMDPDPEPMMSFDDLPNQFSWTDYNGNWLTPVKDQAYPVYCGSCYIFGTWGAFEAAIDIASGYPDTDMDLSEQYGLSCINAGCNGCGGGWGSTMIENIVSTQSGQQGNGINGVPIESCMPYTATDYIPCEDKCEDWDYYTDPPGPDNKLWQIENWGWFSTYENSESDWEIIKTYLKTIGPLAATIAWDSGLQNFFDTHHSPNDVYEQDSSDSTNHIMVLCGWVDDEDIYNGGYWILKNSHGTQKGYGGYVNVAYGCNQMACSECSWIIAEEWPEEEQGPGPGHPDMHVFADFSWSSSYPKLGDTIEFTDESEGNVALREWDFDDDGVVDSTKKRPTYAYYEEGEYDVTLTVWSSAGLNSTRTHIVKVKEVWPPKAVCTPGEYADNELEVTLDGRFSYDVDGKIVGYHWDFDDGSTSDESHLTHEFPEEDRIYNVELTVTDNEGASGSVTVSVCIDFTVPPETEMLLDIGNANNDWYKTSKRVTLIAKDWTGVSYTMYKVDSSDWQKYSKPFMVSSEGEHTISFYSVDVFGNEEAAKSETIRIDKTPPILDISISGDQQDDWYISQVTVSLSGDDTYSGLDLIIYKVDQGGWQEYSGVFTIGDGRHNLWAFAVDNAGNTFGSDEPLKINVDTEVPSTMCHFTGEGSNNMFYQSVEVILVSSDSGAGVDTTFFKLDGGSFEEYTESITVDDVDDHTLSFYAVDRLGNEGQHQTVSFSVKPVNFVLGLDQPSNHLYAFNIEFFSTGKPIILGAVDVVTDVESFTDGVADVDYVEFFVDGESKMIVSKEPFVWRLDMPLFGVHEICVKAFSSKGESVSKSVEATCFIL
jgi:PKD repeat protein/C1A family cysteine protease